MQLTSQHRRYDAYEVVPHALRTELRSPMDESIGRLRRRIHQLEHNRHRCDDCPPRLDVLPPGQLHQPPRCANCRWQRKLNAHRHCAVKGCHAKLSIDHAYRVDVKRQSWRERRDARHRLVSRDVVSDDIGNINLVCTIQHGKRAAQFCHRGFGGSTSSSSSVATSAATTAQSN